MTAQSGIPITTQDLQLHMQPANLMFKNPNWRPRLHGAELRSAQSSGWPESTLTEKSSTSLADAGYTLSNDPMLYHGDVNTLLRIIRDGIAVASYVEDYIGNQVGINDLNVANQRKTLVGDRVQERTDKLKMLAVVRLHVMAQYVSWHLHDFHIEDRTGMNIPFPGLPEVAVTGPDSAVKCAMHYFSAYVKESGQVNTPLELIQFASQYFDLILDHLNEQVVPSLRYADVFTSKRFILDESDFSVEGFELDYASNAGDAVVKPVEFREIIGNHGAKSTLQRIIQMLFLYDFGERKNPYDKIAGFPSIVMLKGKPGTGKTMMIAAAVGKALKLAAQNGLLLRILPMPRDLISKYQGISGERMKRYMDSLRDPNHITIAYADDAEHFFLDRNSNNGSEGSKAVTNEFLVGTEGAQAIEYGNLLFLIATNYPEVIDGAVMNRIQERLSVEGAECSNDYIDFLHLMFKDLREDFPGVADFNAPEDYELMSGQRNGVVLSDSEEKDEPAMSKTVARIMEKVSKDYGPEDSRYFGDLLHGMQQEYEQLSLRDVRNIVKAAKMALAAFEIPEEWATDNVIYIDQPYEVKLEMLKRLMKKYLDESDVDFPGILRRQTIRYLSNYEDIAGAKHKRDVEERARILRVHAEADELNKSRVSA